MSMALGFRNSLCFFFYVSCYVERLSQEFQGEKQTRAQGEAARERETLICTQTSMSQNQEFFNLHMF